MAPAGSSRPGPDLPRSDHSLGPEAPPSRSATFAIRIAASIIRSSATISLCSTLVASPGEFDPHADSEHYPVLMATSEQATGAAPRAVRRQCDGIAGPVRQLAAGLDRARGRRAETLTIRHHAVRDERTPASRRPGSFVCCGTCRNRAATVSAGRSRAESGAMVAAMEGGPGATTPRSRSYLGRLC